jgi:hypothetical protein
MCRIAAEPRGPVRPSPASSPRIVAAVLLRSLPGFGSPCPTECSHRRRSRSGRSAIPAPWPNGWWTGSCNLRRGCICASPATRRVRRIEGEFSEKPLSRFVSGRNFLQLSNVGGSQMTVIVDSLQVGLVPLPNELKFRRPSRFGQRHTSSRTTSMGADQFSGSTPRCPRHSSR